MIEIHPTAFFGCFNLFEIKADENNQNINVIDNVIYGNNMKTLIYYPPSKNEESYVMPNSVENIQKYAFEQTNVQSITISGSVSEIKEETFHVNDNLKEVIILSGNDLIINEGSFDHCKSIQTISVFEKNVEFKNKAFYGSKNISTINYFGDNSNNFVFSQTSFNSNEDFSQLTFNTVKGNKIIGDKNANDIFLKGKAGENC